MRLVAIYGIVEITLLRCSFLKVLRSHARSDGILADFCDGSFLRTHPFLQMYPDPNVP